MMKEKNAVSDGFSPAIVLKLPHSGIPARSSPTHSKYCRAPCFIQTFLPHAAIFLYSAILLLGTGITKPSTYVMHSLLLSSALSNQQFVVKIYNLLIFRIRNCKSTLQTADC